VTRTLVRNLVEELLGRKFNPDQPRDEDGRWSDGMPVSIVSTTLRLAGGSATVDRRPGGDPRLTVGGRSVELSTGRNGGLEQLRRAAVAAQYDDDRDSGPDGVFRVLGPVRNVDGRPHRDALISLRPVPGSLVTEDGQRVSTYEEAPDGVEVYVAEFDMVLNEDLDGEFDDSPSTRVSLSDIDVGNPNGVYERLVDAAAAARVDGGLGPIDVFTPKSGQVGFRSKGDDGTPVEVEFNSRDFRRLDTAIDAVVEDGGTRTIQTKDGPVEVTFRGPASGNLTDENTLIISPSSGGPWSIGATGAGITALIDAIADNGATAGIIR
jgi:hypothetical protein